MIIFAIDIGTGVSYRAGTAIGTSAVSTSPHRERFGGAYMVARSRVYVGLSAKLFWAADAEVVVAAAAAAE